jgi:hypothetical protein
MGNSRGAPFGNRPGSSRHQAKVAELVDALDLGSSAARLESSSLSFRTRAQEVAAIQDAMASYRARMPELARAGRGMIAAHNI